MIIFINFHREYTCGTYRKRLLLILAMKHFCPLTQNEQRYILCTSCSLCSILRYNLLTIQESTSLIECQLDILAMAKNVILGAYGFKSPNSTYPV